MAVGAIEEILMDGEFVSIQSAFCERHCGITLGLLRLIQTFWQLNLSSFSAIFTDDEENKLEFMPIFEEYTALVESTLQKMLTDRLSVCCQ